METKNITIKKVIKSVEEIDINIQLPCYTKKGTDSFFAVYSEKRAIKVYIANDAAVMSDFNFMSQIEEAIEYPPCTEQEFNEAFTQALEFLSKNVNLLVSVSGLPEPDEKLYPDAVLLYSENN